MLSEQFGVIAFGISVVSILLNCIIVGAMLFNKRFRGPTGYPGPSGINGRDGRDGVCKCEETGFNSTSNGIVSLPNVGDDSK